MRIQFAPCGVGLGHAGRCIPIAREIQRRNAETDVFFSTYSEAVSYVRQEGFNTIEVPAMEFKVKPDGAVDFRRTAISPGPFMAPLNFLGQVNKEIEIMIAHRPDVIVSDSRVSPIIAARMLGIPTVCMLNQFQVIIPRRNRYLRLAKFADASTLAIIGRVWTSAAKVIIPDFPPPYTISTGNLHIPQTYQKKIELIGPILPVRPEVLPTKQHLRKKLGLKQKTPLIFVPLSGPLKERAYLTNLLQKIFADLSSDFQIVISLGHPRSHESPVRHDNLNIFRWLPNRFDYLKACDLVVSRAGHGTISQSICYGKPSVLIPTPNHTEQLNNASKCVALGMAVVVHQDNLNKRTLLAAIDEILTKTYSERAKTIQKEVAALDGLSAAIEATFKVVEGGKMCVPA